MLYTFNRGKWEDECPIPEQEDSEDYTAYMRRIGYDRSKTVYGVEHGSWIEVYAHDRDKSFFAAVTPMGGEVFELYIPDFPSLMMFIKDYGGAFAAHASSEYLLAALALQRRLFRITHGHSPDSECSKCEGERF